MLSFLYPLGLPPATRSGVGDDFLLFCRSDSWRIACSEGDDQGRFNNTVCRIFSLANRKGFLFPLAGRGGEGRKWCCWLAWWILLHLGAPHAAVLLADAIFGQEGGQCSTSSGRPSRSNASARRLDASKWFVPGCVLSAGVGGSSPEGRVRATCSDGLGGSTWRSPASCGGDTRGLDCFSFFSSRVFYVKAKALSSNCRSFRARDEKGLFVICTCHVVLY